VPDELDGLVVKVREGVLLSTADVFISSLLLTRKSCNFQDDGCNIVKGYHSPTLLKCNSSSRKHIGWKTTFLWRRELFRGYVKLRGGGGEPFFCLSVKNGGRDVSFSVGNFVCRSGSSLQGTYQRSTGRHFGSWRSHGGTSGDLCMVRSDSMPTGFHR